MERLHRFQVFRKNSQRTRIIAVEELLVLVGKWYVRSMD
jgi:hypothetical protein